MCAPLPYQVNTHSGLMWRWGGNVPILGGSQNNSVDLVSCSGPLTHSTFIDRYPIRQWSAPNCYGISLSSDWFAIEREKV